MSGPQVFAIEDRSVQLTWRRLAPGPVRIEAGDRVTTVDADGGPGTAVLDGLAPGRDHTIGVTSRDGATTLAARTVETPPGQELFRFATIGDLHLGADRFGMFFPLREPDTTEPHPVRCARAAVRDLTEWGAADLVVKGDIVQCNDDTSWALAADLLDGCPMPVTTLAGNHDVAHGPSGGRGAAARRGIRLVDHVEVLDRPGVRLVLMDSSVDDRDVGSWDARFDDVLDAVAEAHGPAMLLVHHHPQPFPVPTFHPPGIDSRIASRFLTALARANPDVIGTSGHTHRCRRRNLAIPWTEVGSMKDYPGVWAGYVVHEGGIRQVVRRVSDPDCLQWLDRTRRVAGGVWELWTPGRLDARCFTHAWRGRVTPRAGSVRGDT